jgi:hypothetical protein
MTSRLGIYLLLAWFTTSTAFLVIVDYAGNPHTFKSLYLIIWVWIIGGFVFWRREKLQQILRAWSLQPVYKFFLLAFGAVLLEEIFAAFINHLTEGFELGLYVARVGQFWALNILAFTGFIVGWYITLKYVRFSWREIIFIGGLWGLYAERTYTLAITNPVAFFLFALPTVLTYGVILLPAYLSLPPGRYTLSPVLRYPLVFAVVFVLSILPFILLTTLREHFPVFFPPRTFIP